MQTLEREIRDFEKDRGARTKAAQDKLKKAKAAVEAGRKELRAAEAALAAAVEERDAAGGEREALQQQMAKAQQSIAGGLSQCGWPSMRLAHCCAGVR